MKHVSSSWRLPVKTATMGFVALSLALTACGTPAVSPPGPTQPQPTAANAGPDLTKLSGTVKVDGSSTVFPITEAVAEEFQKATGAKVRVTVGISGTGGGFKKFCNGETDISDASRPIKQSEIDACKEKGITFIEIPVAYDGLSVLVSTKNTFVESMTVAELKKMWEPDAQGKVTKWNQIRPEWPDRPFRLYGPGADSGTFDYFTEAIMGKAKASRGDFTASEDDNVLVQGIANDANALGFFGYAYYVENTDKLKLVKIDEGKGKGPVAPSPETIANGAYQPLSRPIFIYVKASAMDKPQVREFVKFYLDPKNATTLIKEVGYVAFPDKYYQEGLKRFEAKQVGGIFGGEAPTGVTLDDLFAKTPS